MPYTCCLALSVLCTAARNQCNNSMLYQSRQVFSEADTDGNKDAQLDDTSEPMSTALLTGGDEYKRLLFNM